MNGLIKVRQGVWYGPHPGGADRVVGMVDGVTLNLADGPKRPLSGINPTTISVLATIEDRKGSVTNLWADLAMTGDA